MKVIYKIMDWFFGACNQLIRIVVKYPFLIAAFVIVLVVSIAILLINKDANVGGILGKLLNLLGIDTKNPNPAKVGSKVDKGDFTEYKPSDLDRSSNPFRDKTIIKTPSGQKVKLPNGVKDTDVDTIIEIDSVVTIIPTKDKVKEIQALDQKIQAGKDATAQAQQLIDRLKNK